MINATLIILASVTLISSHNTNSNQHLQYYLLANTQISSSSAILITLSSVTLMVSPLFP